MALDNHSSLSVAEAARLFNTGCFFECHEVLEDIWRPMSSQGLDRLALQGWIQIAVGFLHWQRGNRTGANNLLSAGLEKMECGIKFTWEWDTDGYDWQSFICLCHEELARLQAIGSPDLLPKINLPFLQLKSA